MQRTPSDQRVPSPFRTLLTVVGAAYTAVGVGLYIAPDAFAADLAVATHAARVPRHRWLAAADFDFSRPMAVAWFLGLAGAIAGTAGYYIANERVGG